MRQQCSLSPRACFLVFSSFNYHGKSVDNVDWSLIDFLSLKLYVSKASHAGKGGGIGLGGGPVLY